MHQTVKLDIQSSISSKIFGQMSISRDPRAPASLSTGGLEKYQDYPTPPALQPEKDNSEDKICVDQSRQNFSIGSTPSSVAKSMQPGSA